MAAESQNILKLYKTHNGYFGKLDLDLSKNKINADNKINDDIKTVVILDKSGSMGQNVALFVNHFLPDFLTKLGYTDNDSIRLICFDSFTISYDGNPAFFKSLRIGSGSCTFMAPAVAEMRNYLKNFKPGTKIRLLTLSDGELHDQEIALNEATYASDLLKSKYSINSQAIRLFTSKAQPDTRGLSGMLQLNNTTHANLIDIDTKEPIGSIADRISTLFIDDGFRNSSLVKATKPVFKTSPWGVATKAINAFADNTFWFDEIPIDLTINDEKIAIQMNDPLTVSKYALILDSKIKYYFNQLKVLKVMNTESSKKEINNILQYFTELEKYYEQSKDNTDKNEITNLSQCSTLKSRMLYYKYKIMKENIGIAAKMKQIANDSQVSKFNSAQQADYLRDLDLSRNSKGLAKRAINNNSDLDFDTVVRNEVMAMYANIKELANIDDSDHLSSFFCSDTTLGGIKSLCELAKDNMINQMSATDILQLVNIVGVACTSTIGDFPDPMTWRVDKIFYGCYVSLSDVLTVHQMSGGKGLKPGFGENAQEDIINVIPIFDNDVLHKFVRKYAPSILEYTASIGMRRVIADVPMTYGYSCVAGLWKTVEDLNNNKTDIAIQTFIKLSNSFAVAIGGYFNHVMPYLVDQDPKMSYYIANNGVTNMMNPILRLIQNNNTKNIPRILRALYSYEIWQIIKRKFKIELNNHNEKNDSGKNYDTDAEMNKFLSKFVGINLDKYATPMTPLFENNVTPDLHDKYYINSDIMTELNKITWYVDLLTLIPEYFTALYSKDPVTSIKSIPKMDTNMIQKALDINYDLKLFQFYNVVQALIFNTKTRRVDKDKEKMLIVDLGNKDEAELMVKTFIKKQYDNKYNSDISIKAKTERTELSKILVDMLTETDKLDVFKFLLKNGYTKNKTTASIFNTTEQGYMPLKANLLNMNINVPIRLEKLRIFLLGRDQDINVVDQENSNINVKDEDKIWNNGHVLKLDLSEFQNIFTDMKATDMWNKLKLCYDNRSGFQYNRDTLNRHGHGNEHPSYYYYGYVSTDDMWSSVSNEVFEDYKLKHPHCCFPFSTVKARKDAKKAKKNLASN
jgi:hypothetical protein